MKERLFSFFKMNRLIPVILCLFFATSIYAQNREVKGIVTGDDNEPMAGATIKIKNSQGGAIADIDGKFTMRVKTGDILEISFLGMKKQEIKVDSNDFYSIKLFPEANEFDEVTVVAFAKQKKESVISAISTVNPQELKVPSSNLTTALAGRMSGLIAFQTTGEPGKDNAQFFVRGATTFGYKKDPLILIDNIELSTDDLARLNVDDIAQFSIMKDATATALYGARGANGVILVTTKQGVAGKPKVSVRVEQSVSTPRKKVELTDPITFMRLNNEAVNSRRDPNNPAASANYTVYSQEKIENTIAESRNGLVIGSVEHDNWKTGISIGKGDRDNIGSLVCYGGIADEQTRDVKAHGALAGKKIKSPKVFLGFFEDRCDGLEAYAKANAVIAPPKAWEKAVPFGWNSWGALQFNLTYEKAMEVSDYFKENLQNNHFVNPDQTVYIGLDSGWDCMNEEQLKSFIEKCKSNGQIGGIYWTPFTDWARDPERTVDAAPEYKYKDIYLYANGKPQELDGAYAVDPTHPAVEAMMKKTSGLFHRAGFEYVKMDFMTHGAMEADKWYNPEITTGIQGYNYGMKLLNQYFGDMYINLSISPVFPAQYAQSRRIACDAWNQIKDTEYTLNALSYGWWQKYIYQYNDADHIVLRDATDGENRARITSGVITGIYITGDDFSAGGGKDAKEKSQKYLTNAAVNAVATGEVFRPVEGNGEKSEHIFVRKTPDGRFHCAVFNYSDQEQTTVLSLERIGLDKARNYQVKELWSGNETFATGQLEVTVPSKDVQLLEFK